jgi:hypothetical protein
VPDENIVLDYHAFADERMTGDLAAFADSCILLNFHKCANPCLVPDLAPIEIRKLLQPHVHAKFYVV